MHSCIGNRWVSVFPEWLFSDLHYCDGHYHAGVDAYDATIMIMIMMFTVMILERNRPERSTMFHASQKYSFDVSALLFDWKDGSCEDELFLQPPNPDPLLYGDSRALTKHR